MEPPGTDEMPMPMLGTRLLNAELEKAADDGQGQQDTDELRTSAAAALGVNLADPRGSSSSASRPPPGLEEERQPMFEKYLDEEAVREGLESGRFVKGLLQARAKKLSTAYVRPEKARKGQKDLLIKGKKARNRAVHGDIVICEILPDDRDGGKPRGAKSEPSTGVGEDPTAGVDDDDEEEDEEALGTDLRRCPTIADDEEEDSDEEVVLNGAVLRDNQDAGGAGAGGAAGGRAAAAAAAAHQRSPLARVVAIADPKGSSRVIVCTLHPNRHGDAAEAGEAGGGPNVVRPEDGLLRAQPVDRRMPWILLQVNDVTKRALNIPGRLDPFQFWPIQITVWKESYPLPLGRLKGQCLGRAGDMEAEERHALIEHGFDDHDVDFDDEELDEVDGIVARARASFDEEVRRRGPESDLRGKRIFTIDPATARDLDDAIHVDRLPGDKEVEIGVHIADVGHFVKLGTRTDEEAQRRTTSIYLINRVLPMLPHGLCNHLCSLNPNEPKLSFSVFFRLDIATGDLVTDPKPWFRKTVMRSCCRLNYDEVQLVLDGEEIPVPEVYGHYTWREIKDDLFLLYQVCGKVRRSRYDGGSLAISKVKMIFHTRESEDGAPTNYHLEDHSASHWIIEELMLLANKCVAKHLYFSRLSEVSVLRNHRPPDVEKSGKLATMLKENLGIDWAANPRDAGDLHRALLRIDRRYGHTIGLAISMLVMRSGMMQARYFVCGVEDEEGELPHPHHFALNFDYYTHFTSPIRRYPDLMVHRVLEALLDEAAAGNYQLGEAANNVTEVCNGKKLASRRCSEQLDRAVFCVYLRRRKEWFYTAGTVLKFFKGVPVLHCGQLGIEREATICRAHELPDLQLIASNSEVEPGVPNDWEVKGRGRMLLDWPTPEGGDRRRGRQVLQVLSTVPIVVIPRNTVPIDYCLFLVSPFHQKSQDSAISDKALLGFQWLEPDVDGVRVVHDGEAEDLDGGFSPAEHYAVPDL